MRGRGVFRLAVFGTWALFALLVLGAGSASAETAWVRGAPLNLRTGPGTTFKIVSSVKPGDRIEVRKRGDGWTLVRTSKGREGWIAAGYLDAQPPPRIRLEQLETETTEMRTKLTNIESEAERLQTSNTELSGADEGQRSEIERLTKENYKLRAGSRSAEWITGALVLGTGMALGAIMRGLSARRSRNRLRL